MIRFQVDIQAAAAGGFAVRAACPRGEGRSELSPASLLPAEPSPGAEENPREIGERLFRSLLAGETLSLYERSLDDLESDPEGVLRLELSFDPRDPAVAALQRLPWELLSKPGSPELLALDRKRSIVRYLTVPRRIAAAQKPKKLRILAVAADPRLRGVRPLDLEGELRNLRAAAEESGALELIELPNATLAALRATLVEQEIHVLHFLGHGGRHEPTGGQVLYFEGPHRQLDPVTGSDLMNKLVGFPRLRLVVLNACESGSVPEGSQKAAFDPLAGVATTLVLGGMPAVVAMRKPISDGAALAWSRGFYSRLAAGDPIDAAVVEGRQQVHSKDRGGDEWATPILFLRSATGELYPARDLPPEGGNARLLGRRLAVLVVFLLAVGLAWLGRKEWLERRVQRLSMEGAAQVSAGNWREARELFLAARELAPRSAKVAANLAAAEEQLGDVRSAEDLYRGAAEREPESVDRLYDLGHFLNDHGNPVEAYAVLSKAVTWPAASPRNSEVYAELARAALSRGLFSRARSAIAIALRLDPERAEYHRRLGEIELAGGSPSAAIDSLERALDLFAVGDLGRIETLALLARAEDRLGESAATCRRIADFRLLDTQGISPWAPAVQEIAIRRGCPERTDR